MVLAELEGFFSRPIAPTRRVALGDSTLPTDPAPGFGGVLLGAVAARFGPGLDEDLWVELQTLLGQVERGRRIAQPRLRHRLQVDRVGLQRCRHRMVGDGESIAFEFDESRGTPAQHLLCAAYSAAGLGASVRPQVVGTIRKGLVWRGPIDGRLAAHLAGRHAGAGAEVIGDPVSWAVAVLDLRDVSSPTRAQVQRAFREGIMAAHPDRGGSGDAAAARIDELAEARRILLG